MRYLYSLAASFTILCSTVVAQQPTGLDDRDDPCPGPRMPVIKPDDSFDPKMVVPRRSTPEDIDPQMEIKYCQRKPRVPLSRRVPTPYTPGQLLGPAPRFGFKSPQQRREGASQSSDPLRQQLPPIIEMMRRRR